MRALPLRHFRNGGALPAVPKRLVMVRPACASDSVSKEDGDVPAFNVFTRHGGSIRHFWSVIDAEEVASPTSMRRDTVYEHSR